MMISASSEAGVLSQKRIECPLWVGEAVLEEFKYLRIKNASDL